MKRQWNTSFLKKRIFTSHLMSLGRTIEILACFVNKPNIMMVLIGEWTSCLAICFFSRFCGVENLKEFHEDKVSRREFDVTDFLQFQIAPIRGANIWVLFFFDIPPHLQLIISTTTTLHSVFFGFSIPTENLICFTWQKTQGEGPQFMQVRFR